jgi:LPXTG-site transpeptidase (sortase) family protein
VEGNALKRLAATPAGTYQVCLQTEDENSESFQKDFSIFVNEAPPHVPGWTISLTGDHVIDGDPPDTVVGTLTSTLPKVKYQLVDSSSFPFTSNFHLSQEGVLSLSVTADFGDQRFFPLRILATDSKGELQYLDVIITVMKNGRQAGAKGVNDVGRTVTAGKVTIDVLSNDTFSQEANSWSFHEIVEYPKHGTAAIGSIIYTSKNGYAGKDQLTYRACDNMGYCVVAGVTIHVRHKYEIPLETGFAPGRETILPGQPDEYRYDDINDITIEIPDLGVNSPILGIPILSYGWDLTWLGRDVGWLQGSAYPTWNGNSVLTGHVTNADGGPGIFVDLGKMRWGEQVIIHLKEQNYIYEVREVLEKIDPDDMELMMLHKESPWLTLVTCQGYDPLTNTYRYRTLVRAALIKVK